MRVSLATRRGMVMALSLASMTLLYGTTPTAAFAQDYPAQTLRMVIPYPPGGGTDVMGRALADQMSTQLGQPVIVENKPGANGSIATRMTIDAKPDGYTILYTPTVIITANPHLYKLQYDVRKQLRPVALGPTTNFVLVAHPSVPFTTLQELVAYAKNHPGKLTFASAGQASLSHLLIEMLRAKAGIDVLHVPYKGGAPALNDVLGGQVQLLFDVVQSVQPHIGSGRLKALAVSRAQRSSQLPDVPSMSESLQGIDIGSSHALFAPVDVPESIVQRLNSEFTKAMFAPAVKARIAQGGYDAKGASIDEFARLVTNEYQTMGKLISDLQLKPE